MMPYRPAGPCRVPGCPGLATRRGFCEQHAKDNYSADYHRRGNSIDRGYGPEWKEIRARVLRAHGVPEDQWHLWTVDHRPVYDRDKEPNHNMYELVPMLRTEHSRKTAREDGGFGNRQAEVPK